MLHAIFSDLRKAERAAIRDGEESASTWFQSLSTFLPIVFDVSFLLCSGPPILPSHMVKTFSWIVLLMPPKTDAGTG